MTKGRTLIIKDCVQISSCPPTFIFFVNYIELVHFSYKRFIENYLRKHFNLSCLPIVLIFKKDL
ncbi:MAG: hypothetical protein LBM96_02290 [Methanobrevibacter sp.]|nr:hypothetical protein [Candidatus Methanoflexus mossambicus]